MLIPGNVIDFKYATFVGIEGGMSWEGSYMTMKAVFTDGCEFTVDSRKCKFLHEMYKAGTSRGEFIIPHPEPTAGELAEKFANEYMKLNFNRNMSYKTALTEAYCAGRESNAD